MGLVQTYATEVLYLEDVRLKITINFIIRAFIDVEESETRSTVLFGRDPTAVSAFLSRHATLL